MQITCLACGHVADVPAGPAFDDAIFQCGECGARMAYGRLMPRVVVEPYEDERGHRWLRRRFQDPQTKKDVYVIDVDAQQAASEAKNILTLVLP